MLKNCSLSNINALFGQKGKNVTGKWDRTFFNFKLHPGYFLENYKVYMYIFVIFLIACAIQYHRSVFIFIFRRILSTQLSLSISGHSLPTKLYIDPYKPHNSNATCHLQVCAPWRTQNTSGSLLRTLVSWVTWVGIQLTETCIYLVTALTQTIERFK